MTYDEFKRACFDAIVAAHPECAGWQLRFEERDFQREWGILAIASDGLEEDTTVSTAKATASTPREVIQELILKIRQKQANG